MKDEANKEIGKLGKAGEPIQAEAWKDRTDIEIAGNAEGVTEIGDEAFMGTGLESIKIPQSVQKIGSDAFADCANLVSALVPAHLKARKSSEFYRCDALKELIRAISEKM